MIVRLKVPGPALTITPDSIVPGGLFFSMKIEKVPIRA
jgi:hypothetical protein